MGSGIAGLTAALEAAPLKTLVLTKTEFLTSGSSAWAQGGIAFPFDESDISSHIKDTLLSGAGLCDPAAVKVLVENALEARFWLERKGVEFDRSLEGHYRLGKEGAHSLRRIFHVQGDSTGREMVRVLMEKAQAATHITLKTGVLALRILKDREGSVNGLFCCDKNRGSVIFETSTLVLAGGGLGQLFGRTTNPAESTGDALALAEEAGAELCDLEMVQFHPTGLDISSLGAASDQYPLLSEALRGEGATLIFSNGKTLPIPHPMGVLGPRDVVARAIFQAIQLGRAVFLDARKVAGAKFPERFPTVFNLCMAHGLDPRKDLLPVTPVVHYAMGGVKTGLWGETSLKGLWVTGESARTGVHGANRLASNSLLECVVFSLRAIRFLKENLPPVSPGSNLDEEPELEPIPTRSVREKLQKIMFTSAGPVRDEETLSHGLEALEDLRDDIAHDDLEIPQPFGSDYHHFRHSIENRNLFRLAPLILRAALERRESRGAHYRRDYPE